MKKKRKTPPRLSRFDRVCIGFIIVATAMAIFFGIAGQSRAEPADPRYPFLSHVEKSTHTGWSKKSTWSARLVIVDANGADTQIIGGRPAGCPHRYCGCGLRKYLGIDDRRLDLAWNWAEFFPRTIAAPGMAAVRKGHVMLLVAHVSGNDWIVRDYNSGRGLSQIHERNVRGYVFVDPSARHMAMMR